jgi:hypothetical protein
MLESYAGARNCRGRTRKSAPIKWSNRWAIPADTAGQEQGVKDPCKSDVWPSGGCHQVLSETFEFVVGKPIISAWFGGATQQGELELSWQGSGEMKPSGLHPKGSWPYTGQYWLILVKYWSNTGQSYSIRDDSTTARPPGHILVNTGQYWSNTGQIIFETQVHSTIHYLG